MSDDQDTDHVSGDSSSPPFMLVWIVLVLLIAYPLSIGPVARIYRGVIGGPPRIVQAFYSPLVQVCGMSPGGDKLLRWYVVDVWGVK